MKTLPPKTRAEIDALKASWREDPSWDLEETEGFEAHKAELLRYRVEVEAKHAARAARSHERALERLQRPAMERIERAKAHPMGQMVGEIAAIIAAEMLLPLQRQLERQAEDIEAMQRRHEDEIDALRRQLRDR